MFVVISKPSTRPAVSTIRFMDINLPFGSFFESIPEIIIAIFI